MANNPLDKVYLDSAMLDAVAAGGEITSGSDTYTADEDTIYMIPEEIGDLVQTTGTSTSDVMSQKAVTDALANKVDKTTSASKVYATDSSGNQTTLSIGTSSGNVATYGSSSTGSSEPSGYLVSHDPSANYQTATKHYVDGRVTANPSGTASTNLTKLQVGNTIYGISSGSTMYVHQLTIDVSGTPTISFNMTYYSSASTAYTASTLPSDVIMRGIMYYGYYGGEIIISSSFTRYDLSNTYVELRFYSFDYHGTFTEQDVWRDGSNLLTVYDTVTVA